MGKFRENGFSLVEVLVSIVVLAIGVIGAAGMQLAAQRAVQQAAFQNFAVQLGAEIADAIRAAGRQAVSAEEILAHVDYRSADHGELPAPEKLCYAQDCDAQEFLRFEVYEWKRRIRNALPGGRLQVCRDVAHENAAVDRLSWDCNETQESGAPLVIKLGWRSRNPDGTIGMDAGGEFPPLVALTVSVAAE